MAIVFGFLTVMAQLMLNISEVEVVLPYTILVLQETSQFYLDNSLNDLGHSAALREAVI